VVDAGHRGGAPADLTTDALRAVTGGHAPIRKNPWQVLTEPLLNALRDKWSIPLPFQEGMQIRTGGWSRGSDTHVQLLRPDGTATRWWSSSARRGWSKLDAE
jgi:hypothetical protein